MSKPMTWQMPGPPPANVLSVRDAYGRCWESVADTDGLWWRDDTGKDATWEWLLYHRGQLTADEVAH